MQAAKNVCNCTFGPAAAGIVYAHVWPCSYISNSEWRLCTPALQATAARLATTEAFKEAFTAAALDDACEEPSEEAAVKAAAKTLEEARKEVLVGGRPGWLCCSGASLAVARGVGCYCAGHHDEAHQLSSCGDPHHCTDRWTMSAAVHAGHW